MFIYLKKSIYKDFSMQVLTYIPKLKKTEHINNKKNNEKIICYQISEDLRLKKR